MLESAKQILVSELIMVQGIDRSEIMDNLERLLIVMILNNINI